MTEEFTRLTTPDITRGVFPTASDSSSTALQDLIEGLRGKPGLKAVAKILRQ